MDKDIDQALRYIFGYIRNNTDLLSAGMYNYNLFDFIIRNINQHSNKLDRILQNAKVELSSFMDFLTIIATSIRVNWNPKAALG